MEYWDLSPFLSLSLCFPAPWGHLQHLFLPGCVVPPQVQSKRVRKPWIAAFEITSQSKFFFFISYIRHFCHSYRKLANTVCFRALLWYRIFITVTQWNQFKEGKISWFQRFQSEIGWSSDFGAIMRQSIMADTCGGGKLLLSHLQVNHFF